MVQNTLHIPNNKGIITVLRVKKKSFYSENDLYNTIVSASSDEKNVYQHLSVSASRICFTKPNSLPKRNPIGFVLNQQSSFFSQKLNYFLATYFSFLSTNAVIN